MRRRGFTLTEMLVVIAVIGILMALLLGGIQRARVAGRSTQQLNDIRQMHMAWTLYAGQSNESCLPGYMSVDVQRAWKLSYKMKQTVGTAGTDKLDRQVTQTYPWRLMPFLDHSVETMFGYRAGDDDGSATFSLDVQPLALPVGATLDPALQPLMDNPALLGRTIALQPAFGYNAFYLGGWWTMGSGADPVPEVQFGRVRPMPAVASALRLATDRTIEVVTRKVGSVRRPEQMVAFVSSTFMPGAGSSFDAGRKPEPTALGAAWCRAPFMGGSEIWGTGQLGGDSVWVRTTGTAPLMRYANDIASVHVDGSTMASTARQLKDMRNWVNLPELPNALADEAVHQDP
jgi:prepilin-type N-terminal cleavage/methylation domain-containing protein